MKNAPIPTLIVFAIILAISLSNSSAGEVSDCIKGLDCPEDIPREPVPVTPPDAGGCEFPVYNLYYQMAGMQWAARGFGAPASHCCLENGKHVPLQEPGRVREGMPCYVQTTLFGFIPETINGLACRCVPVQ